MFVEEQLEDVEEQEICNMVIANNYIRLREIQSAIINDNNVFANIHSVSISTIDRILKIHQMTMKQLYKPKVLFERSSEGAAVPVCQGKLLLCT